mgnify:FL=1
MKTNRDITYLKKCKICGNKNLKKVLFINEQYISATFVKSNKNNKLTKIKTPLTLVLCDKTKNKKGCGLLQLLEITKPDLLYRKYFYRSATNDTMRKDLKDVVDCVIKIAKPKYNDLIVDIGSNDCTLLNFYNKKYKLIGFEPARNIRYINKGKKIQIFKNYFNYKDFEKKYSNSKAKIITSCAMFYDIAEPKKFVADVDKILHQDGIWCVQISYLASMINFNNFYDICHEHLSYYSIETFENLLKPFNLRCFYAETNAVNGGSVRLYVCRKNSIYSKNKLYNNSLVKIKKLEKKLKLTKASTFYNFQKKIDNIKSKTNSFVDLINDSDEQIFALGASTKGNILLQHFGLDKSRIPYISERNPEKVGLRCLGSDIKLISEKQAREKKPKAFLVLPWNFKKEIVNREKNYINKGGILMFPMPYPHYVSKKGEEKL